MPIRIEVSATARIRELTYRSQSKSQVSGSTGALPRRLKGPRPSGIAAITSEVLRISPSIPGIAAPMRPTRFATVPGTLNAWSAFAMTIFVVWFTSGSAAYLPAGPVRSPPATATKTGLFIFFIWLSESRQYDARNALDTRMSTPPRRMRHLSVPMGSHQSQLKSPVWIPHTFANSKAVRRID